MELDNGEAEAIALAIEKNAKLVLLDELAARNIAQFHSINFIGTIGCLVLVKRRGYIDSIKSLLDLIQTEGHFWISKKLYKRILIENNEQE